MTQTLSEILVGLASPWKTREQAAEYLQCSESLIDRLADQGKLPRYFRTGKPLFKREDLDACVVRKKEGIKLFGRQ